MQLWSNAFGRKEKVDIKQTDLAGLELRAKYDYEIRLNRLVRSDYIDLWSRMLVVIAYYIVNGRTPQVNHMVVMWLIV